MSSEQEQLGDKRIEGGNVYDVSLHSFNGRGDGGFQLPQDSIKQSEKEEQSVSEHTQERREGIQGYQLPSDSSRTASIQVVEQARPGNNKTPTSQHQETYYDEEGFDPE